MPVRGIASRRPRRGLGGLAEVTEEAGDVRRLGDEGEEAHATAAPGTGLDVDAERPPEELSPRPVARAGRLAGRRRTARVGRAGLRVVVVRVRRGPRHDERPPLGGRREDEVREDANAGTLAFYFPETQTAIVAIQNASLANPEGLFLEALGALFPTPGGGMTDAGATPAICVGDGGS